MTVDPKEANLHIADAYGRAPQLRVRHFRVGPWDTPVESWEAEVGPEGDRAVGLAVDAGRVFLSDAVGDGRVSVLVPGRLDAEVRRILDEQEAVSRSILLAHGRVVDALAQALIAQETIQGQALAKLLGHVRLYRRPGAAGPGDGNGEATAGFGLTPTPHDEPTRWAGA